MHSFRACLSKGPASHSASTQFMARSLCRRPWGGGGVHGNLLDVISMPVHVQKCHTITTTNVSSTRPCGGLRAVASSLGRTLGIVGYSLPPPDPPGQHVRDEGAIPTSLHISVEKCYATPTSLPRSVCRGTNRLCYLRTGPARRARSSSSRAISTQIQQDALPREGSMRVAQSGWPDAPRISIRGPEPPSHSSGKAQF